MATAASDLSLRNRCLDSKSPYVRSHSSNPTAWQLWDPDTLALAKSTNRLLFVSIGYSACHWCHVMASESFSHPGIAKLLNDNFIPVKIDREERPDVDRVYMDFLQATTGGGGWPLNVFVTPDLQPLFGGTYWPGPENERPGRGGSFEVLLEKLAATWAEQEQRCREDAGRITTQLKEFAQEGTLGRYGEGIVTPGTGDELPDIELLEDAFQHYKARYDDKYAGFGGAPKFPTPTHLSFLLRIAQWPRTAQDIVGDDEAEEARTMVIATLDAMSRGGIKDQVGHGFSRYSVTRDWSLPHFEKMLYDNAQLLSTYLDAWLITKSEDLLNTVHDIATYLTSAPIQSPTGGFHASEDADSAPAADSTEHKEGAFYVWTDAELRKAINNAKAADVTAAYFNVKAQGNVSRKHDIQGELVGQNTLCGAMTYSEIAEKHAISETEVASMIRSSIETLRSHRERQRPRPHLDDKILVSWNGLAISALARTAAALCNTDKTRSDHYLHVAIRAAAFIRESLYDKSSHTLLRVYREGPGTVPGFADDYAFLITGLIDLYEATADDSWLSWAYDLQQTQIRLFYDETQGAFFSTSMDAPDILIRSKDAMDSAEPSTNGASASNLFRLAGVLGIEDGPSTSGRRPAPPAGPLATASTPSHETDPTGDPASTVGPTTTNSLLSTNAATVPYPADDTDLHSLAKRTLRAFDAELAQHPAMMTGLLGPVVMARLGVKALIVSGQGPRVEEALDTYRTGVWPGVVLVNLSTSSPSQPESQSKSVWLTGRNESLRAAAESKRELVQICAGGRCRLVESQGELLTLLRE